MTTRRGFAMLMAVGMLALVGAAFLAIATLASMDARRSTGAWQEAQLRQLLLAGAAGVQERAGAWGESPAAQSFDLTLPPGLTGEGGQVRVTIALEGQAMAAEVVAQFAGRSARQQLQLRRSAGAWRITAAALNPAQ